MGESSEGTYCYRWPRPAVTVDALVFAPRAGRLRVLLIKRGHAPFAGCWALPGGFIDIEEPLEDAVIRELREETGFDGRIGPQVGAYGAPGRDPRGRTIGIAYLVEPAGDQAVKGGDDAAEARWWPVDSLPPLAFDHAQMIADGLAKWRAT